MTIIVCTAAGVFLLWAAWWVYRGTPQHGKHYTTVAPPAAAHHPLPKIIADGGELYDLDEVAKEFGVDLGPDTDTWPAPRHTHRDPITGRYTRKEQ